VVWVPFTGALVVDGAADVVAALVWLDGGAEVVAASVSVVEAASEEVAGTEALVSVAPVGMLRVTPAPAQRDWAAATVFPISASEHPVWTQGRRELTKAEA